MSFILLLLTILTLENAEAATQGTLGVNSTGSYNVTLVINNRLRISDLSDISFGQYTGTGDVDMNDDICIYSNIGTGLYQVTATGDGAGSAFTIRNGVNAIPYTVAWNDVTGTSGGANLLSGTVLNGRTGANQSAEDCSVGGLSANIRIQMTNANIWGNPNGAYVGVLTLLIEPD